MARIFTVACVVALLIADFGDSTLAGVISVEGDTGDGQVDVNGHASDFSQPIVKTGTGGNIVRGFAVVWFFELPVLSCPSTQRSLMRSCDTNILELHRPQSQRPLSSTLICLESTRELRR